MLLLWIIYVISVLFLLCFRARLFIDALWSAAGKGLASWLSFVMSYCEVDTFQLIFDPYLLFFKVLPNRINNTNSANLYPPTKGYFRKACKSQNMNPDYLYLKFTLGNI